MANELTPETIYSAITTRLGLRSLILVEEFRAPAAPYPDFGVPSFFGERPIDWLLERQNANTAPLPDPRETRLMTPPCLAVPK